MLQRFFHHCSRNARSPVRTRQKTMDDISIQTTLFCTDCIFASLPCAALVHNKNLLLFFRDTICQAVWMPAATLATANSAVSRKPGFLALAFYIPFTIPLQLT